MQKHAILPAVARAQASAFSPRPRKTAWRSDITNVIWPHGVPQTRHNSAPPSLMDTAKSPRVLVFGPVLAKGFEPCGLLLTDAHETYALPTRSLRAPYAERAVTLLDLCEVPVSSKHSRPPQQNLFSHQMQTSRYKKAYAAQKAYTTLRSAVLSLRPELL